MATNTPNLDLRQPAGTDYVQVLQDISNNMGKIDTFVGNLNTKVNNSAFPVQVGTSISTATDFNTFTTPGIYTIPQDATVRDSANSPSIYAGKLCVYSNSGNPFTSAWQYGQQIYRDRIGNEYVRGVNSGASGVVSFGTWGRVLTNNDFAIKTGTVVSNAFLVMRSGNFVYGFCVGGNYDIDANGKVCVTGTTTPIQVPIGYKPAITAVQIFDTNIETRLLILTNGQIEHPTIKSVTNKAFRFSACWITTDTYPS